MPVKRFCMRVLFVVFTLYLVFISDLQAQCHCRAITIERTFFTECHVFGCYTVIWVASATCGDQAGSRCQVCRMTTVNTSCNPCPGYATITKATLEQCDAYLCCPITAILPPKQVAEKKEGK